MGLDRYVAALESDVREHVKVKVHRLEPSLDALECDILSCDCRGIELDVGVARLIIRNLLIQCLSY
jgi:hypothetical protein